MNLSYHLAASAVIVVAGVYTGHPGPGAAAAAANVLIDIDHWVDYWHENGIRFNVPDFMSYCNGGESRTLSMILHSWEVVAAVATGGVLLASPLLLGTAFGLFCHIAMDAWSYRKTARPAIFFLIPRIRYRFRRDALTRVFRAHHS